MASRQRVLVVDGLAETEEVLRAVLEPRGLEVDRIRAPRPEEISGRRRPSLVVLHVDDAASTIPPDGWNNVPRVVIGATTVAARSANAAAEHYLEKPFQYGELIRAIERLLADAPLAAGAPGPCLP